MKTPEVNIEQLFETVAYGDALGLPVETLTHAQITEQYGRVEVLQPVSAHAFFQGIFEEGMWSDDTQLTLVVAEALMKGGGFDMTAQAEGHIESFHQTPKTTYKGKTYPRGWGGSTTRSVGRLIRGVSPDASGESEGQDKKMGNGNGVLMKIAPLAAWTLHNTENGEVHPYVEQLTRMTHDTDTAVAASQVHVDILRALPGLREGFRPGDFVDAMHDAFKTHKDEYPEGITEVVKALNYLYSHPKPTPEIVLGRTDAAGFYAPQTLAMAYGAFLMDQSFPEVAINAVNLGGDTDSIASIAGSMALFLHGEVELPEDAKALMWEGENGIILNRQHLIDIGKQFARFVVGETES